jgi:hydrophobe/amphiphile efflux-1 (HAE1) family protein
MTPMSYRRPRHEPLGAVRPATGCNHAAFNRISADRPGQLSRVTRGEPAGGRSTDVAGVGEPPRRRSRNHGIECCSSTSISIQFDLSRKIDKAAQDVQSAINAASADLPSDMPTLPTVRKANPAAAPILVIALTSPTLQTSALYDIADSVFVQRLSQVDGVADVNVSGAEQPAIRVEVDPAAIADSGLTLEQIRTVIANGAALGPVGMLDGARQSEIIKVNAQFKSAAEYQSLVLRAANGTVVRLTDIAKVTDGVRNTRAAGTYDGLPAVIINITKSADANVVATADRVRALIPDIRRWIPADIDIAIMSDRTKTIRASIEDMQKTLVISIVLVMGVVLLFLGRTVPMIAAGITIPLSFAGTFAGMWLAGFSVDNLSLMALAISVGFVVDDAIVVIENVMHKIEDGAKPLEAAIAGAGGIAFTVITISLSLVAAFLPLMFLSGTIGKFLKEFALTVTFAIAVSTVVALTVTPMICGHYLKATSPSQARRTLVSRAMDATIAAYARSLTIALRHVWFMLLTLVATVVLASYFFINLPKGYFPQDDTGLVLGWTNGPHDISFPEMHRLQELAAAIISADPAVAHVGSFVGGGSSNSGRVMIALKPIEERKLSAQRVIARIREALRAVSGVSVFMFPAQDVRIGGRQGKSEYQFTLWSGDLAELRRIAPLAADRIKAIPGVVDVSTDQEWGGLQANVHIDRPAAAQLRVGVQDIVSSLNDVFSQRQIATIYGERNQYRVVMAADPRLGRSPDDIASVHVPSKSGIQVPITAVATTSRSLAPLAVNHQGQFAAVTVSFGLAPDMSLGVATPGIRAAIAGMALPETVHAEFAGDAAAFANAGDSQTLLVIGALVAIYILLGVLYESLLHPLTILSTLPSAGLGALLALYVIGNELTLVAFIGIILLIGIVKKNGIMLVDHALDLQNKMGLAPHEAITRAAAERFRPIIMTTLAAMLGALPLLLGEGPGSELRRPLGVTVVGGLFVSQILTLYTTPAMYLALERLRGWAHKSA